MKVLNWFNKHKITIIACTVTAVLTIAVTTAFFVYSNITALYVKFLINNSYVDNVSDETLKEGAISGMIDALGDDFSTYIPSAYGYDRYDSKVTGEFEGIGISIEYINGNTQITDVFENSPADNNGVLKGDIIVSGNGTDLKGKTPTEVADVLRGEAGTSVNLTVLRGEETLEIKNIVRAAVSTPSVNDKIYEKNIGYIAISNFDADTDKELKEKLELLKDTKSLIVDLRNNPGGRLDTVISSIDLFLDEGVVLTAKYKGNAEDVYKSTDQVMYDKPMVVLVNSNSASAAEIFAAALKERDRAKIVGTNTFGKGSIQRSYMLPDNAGANITVGRFYSPDGNKIDKIGVKPDIEVNISENYEHTVVSQIPYEEDKQLIKAIQILR